MLNSINPDWRELLLPETQKPYYKELEKFVNEQYDNQKVFPKKENIFRALNKCPLDKVKVVIIGQDPYHNDNQANGLCFSVNEGIAFPPSLKNIFKELQDDLGTKTPESGDLERWAEQGVLMLNAVLTVKAHSAASHAKKGWEKFTDEVIKLVAENKTGVVYMLWGSYAQKKCCFVDEDKNLVLRSVHPSPLSCYRGFIGCKHFSQANAYLSKPIVW